MTMAGYSIITLRRLFVRAHATPTELFGDRVLVDKAIQESTQAWSIRGISLGSVLVSSGNCLAGRKS